MIEILINDQTTEVSPGTTLAELAAQFGQDPNQPIAVALNGEFVPKSQYPSTQMQAGDALDIVSPVGGG